MQVGDKAPEILGINEKGEEIRLSDYKGKKIVLYFYPKDMKNNLPFPLIADTDKKLVEQFGVWGEKSMYGRKYMGTFRTTFIINEEGVIERIITPKEVKTKDHAAQIL